MSNLPERHENDALFGLAARAVGSAASIGLTLASAPLVLLPARSRAHVRKAMAELALGAVALPRGVSNAVENLVDDIWANENAGLSDVPLSERARNFARRVADAADDVNAALGNVARRAGDAVEDASADVDAWAAGAPRTARATTTEAAKTVDDWVEQKTDGA
jgi:hypothetical protein